MTIPNEDTSNLDDFIAEMNGEPPVETTPVAEEPPTEVEETPEEAPAPDDGEETPEETSEEPKKGRSTADRIRKLTAEKKAAERARENDIAALRAEIEALKKAATPAPLTETPKTDNNAASGAPDPAKYQYGELDPQYMSDVADYRADLRIAALKAEMAEQTKATQQADAAQREAAAFREKAVAINQAGVAKFNDFEEVVVEAAKRGEYTLTKEMFELATETDAPAEMLYHLASNPEEAELVASLPYAKQALWFGKMQAKFAAPPPARVPRAPPPLATPTRGSGGRFEVPDDTDDLAAFERKFFSRG